MCGPLRHLLAEDMLAAPSQSRDFDAASVGRERVAPEADVAMASGHSLEEALGMARPSDRPSSRPSPDATGTAIDLVAAAERLRRERDEVVTRLASMTTDLESLFAASADSNADDEHDPEGQTIAYERSQLTALLQAARDHLAGIEAGMLRLEQGIYGVCEVCHEPIPAARLEARPTARTCIQHAVPSRG
jgi:RNA polymerase-binding transcription factor DksA